MDLNKKNILIMGLGISGLSTIRALHNLGANILINDIKNKDELVDVTNSIEDIPFTDYLGQEDVNLSNIDIIIKSPGIPPNNKIILKAKDLDIEIINDIELSYRLSKSKNIIAITGTNGKTTTTSLTGEIFASSKYNSFIGGNIGKTVIDKMINSKEEDIFILEVSSFQLEHTLEFKPKISLIINITPDHLDWHGSFDNYINSKKKIFNNQDDLDFTVLNYDDKLIRSFKEKTNSNVVFFSTKEELNKGIYIKDNNIIINIDNDYIEVLAIDKLLLKGEHNLENVLGSIAISYIMDIPIEKIRDSLLKFKGVEHRLEFVVEKNGIKFFNDSKGTNVDSSIKAIEAIDKPIVLIAGGYDKNIEFDDFIRAFNSKVKALILLGATSKKIEEAALRQGFKNSFIAKDMEEAVRLAYNASEIGDSILLSPACASWGMFKNFEERGEVFKKIVSRLGED